MKRYTKKELRKLVKPGVWVQVDWNDAPDSVVLVIDADHEGFDCLELVKKRWERNSFLEYGQVVEVFDAIEPPMKVERS